MSLRRRLVVGILLLLVVGIGVTDVVTRLTLRSFLYGRLDEQVDVAQSQAYSYLESNYLRALAAGNSAVASNPGQWLAQLSLPEPALGFDQAGPADSGDLSASSSAGAAPATGVVLLPARAGRLLPSVLGSRVSPDIYVEVLDAKGQVLLRRPSGSSAAADPPPALPAHLPVRRAPPPSHFGTSHGVYLPDQPTFTIGARGKSGNYYRGEALSVPGGVLLTAIPLAPTVQTLKSLTRVEAAVSGIVLLALIVLVLWTVQIGLRPLEEMTETARAIAAGDMRRRVRRSDERSEVGRLGGALNGMLSQIEAAFAERRTSERQLRRFVADASHELRTPLTSIRGYAELLRKGALDDDGARRRAAERIEHEAARMGVLVDDLLLLARLDQGRPLERTDVDLATIVAEAVEAARAAAPDRPVDVMLRGDALVEGDAARLRQVVDNLLANAALHTPQGTPVHVELTRDDGHVELSVADEGPGLSAEEAERVFDRFYRGSDARRRPGTGLGLSIVAALAEAHGGRATVRTAPGAGARFVVLLPCSSAGAADHPDASRDGHEDERADEQGEGASADAAGADGNIGRDGTTSGAPARR